MPSPQTLARIQSHMRRAWQEHLEAITDELTWDNAEEFLESAQEAIRTLAEDLKTRLELGVAEAVHVAWAEEREEWRAAVYLQDGRRNRCPMSEYMEMPKDVTEDELRKAVVEIAFVHNVSVGPFDVQVDVVERFASWGEYETRRS